MATLKEIEETLRGVKPLLREKFKVQRIGVFGSYAKGNAGDKSDVDILVEFSEPVGWEFLDLKEYLEELLKLEVDLVTAQALKPRFREEVLTEVVYA